MVGDVHGCADALYQLVHKISLLPYAPTVVFAGDLLDRGAQGPEVWDLVRTMCKTPEFFNVKETVVLRGNHEQMMLDANTPSLDRLYWKQMWRMNGGQDSDFEYIRRYSNTEVNWLRSLRFFYKHPSNVYFNSKATKLLVTHASVLPRARGGDVSTQDPEYLLWERNIAGYGLEWLTVHGHTIQRNAKPVLHSTLTGKVLMIDTGSFLTGVVTGVEFVDVV